MTRPTAAAVVFCAAAAVLVLEILALRMLAPYVGLTLETSSTVIGVMLGGIAAGAAAGGALSDRDDPRVVVAWALVAGGLLAMATVPLVRVLGDALESAGGGAALPIALAAFFMPAAVLSTVTPAVAKLQLESLATTGSVVGRLSAWATAGALVGTFPAGWVLVPLLPTTPTVLAVGGVLVVAGIAGGLRLGALRRTGAGIAVALAALVALSPALLGERCDAESAYFCAEVEVDPDRPSGRTLVLDDVPNSYVDLDDPRHLEFDYTRWMSVSLARADRAVFIGGGGFTLPRWLAAVRPGAGSRVLEVDRKLVGLARDRLGLGDVPGMEVRTGDARLTLRDVPPASADVVVGDAFGGRTVPWHLTTREFLAEIRRVLRPDGIYVMNVIDHGPQKFARAQAATFRESFAHVAAVGRGQPGALPGGGNVVLLGSRRPLPESALTRERGTTLLRGPLLRRYTGDAQVLRDDYAPTDQLLSTLP